MGKICLLKIDMVSLVLTVSVVFRACLYINKALFALAILELIAVLEFSIILDCKSIPRYVKVSTCSSCLLL